MRERQGRRTHADGDLVARWFRDSEVPRCANMQALSKAFYQLDIRVEEASIGEDPLDELLAPGSLLTHRALGSWRRDKRSSVRPSNQKKSCTAESAPGVQRRRSTLRKDSWQAGEQIDPPGTVANLVRRISWDRVKGCQPG